MGPSPATTTDRHNASDTMSPPNEGASQKRKSEDGGAPQTRAKRNRYISIAWYAGLGRIVQVDHGERGD